MKPRTLATTARESSLHPTLLRLEALREALKAAAYQEAPNTAENIRATARVFFNFLNGDKDELKVG